MIAAESIVGSIATEQDNKYTTLKPCPFCGAYRAYLVEDERLAKKGYDFPKWYIRCLSCGVRTPTARVDEVVKIWNRRTNGNII